MNDREDFFRDVEREHSKSLPRKAWHVIRVDGRAFHTFTRDMARPFDLDFMDAMDSTAKELCREVQGAVFAYVQSDEISVLVRPPVVRAGNLSGGMWFGGSLRKWLSVSAGVASARMTMAAGKMGHFDSRVLSLTDEIDVKRYFLWRQYDCARNAIQATAQHHIGHKNLLGKDRTLQIQMLAAAGVDYSALPQGWRQGRVVVPVQSEALVAYRHKRTGELHTTPVVRTWWQAQEAPWFDWDEAGFLASRLAGVRKENSEQAQA